MVRIVAVFPARLAGVLVLAAPAVLGAHAGNNDPNAVHACINDLTGITRIVAATAACLSAPRQLAEHPAHWAVVGPRGEQGVQGDAGPQGLQGPPGETGPQGAPGSAAAWSEAINVPGERFVVLASFNNAAVLDKETGLVWERNPLHPQPDVINSDPAVRTWWFARSYCAQKEVGRRFGWRLPTVQELSSLVDAAGDSLGRFLPPGHPFANIEEHGMRPDGYWTATSWDPGFPLPDDNAFIVQFANRISIDYATVIAKTDDARVWCVRGGNGLDVQ
jgi:hypothetical protein